MKTIEFTHLDPEDLHTCQRCDNIYLDIDEGFKCRVHPGMKYTNMQLIAANTCDDYLTAPSRFMEAVVAEKIKAII